MIVVLFFIVVSSLSAAEVISYSPGLLKLLHPNLQNWHFQAGRFMRNQDLASLRVALGRLDSSCLRREEEIRHTRQTQRVAVAEDGSSRHIKYQEINQALRLDLKGNQEQCQKQRQELTDQYFYSSNESKAMLEKMDQEIETALKSLTSPNAMLIRQPEQVSGLTVSVGEIDLQHLNDPFHPLGSFLSQDFERLDRIQAMHNINLPPDEATDQATLETMKQYVNQFLILNVFPAVFTDARDISEQVLEILGREWKLSSAQIHSLKVFVRGYLQEAIR